MWIYSRSFLILCESYLIKDFLYFLGFHSLGKKIINNGDHLKKKFKSFPSTTIATL